MAHQMQPQLPPISTPVVNSYYRLPAYRVSHQGRFHPYGRIAPRTAERDLMRTVDYRFDDPLPRRSLTLSVVPEEEEEQATNLASVVPRLEREEGRVRRVEEVKRLSLADLIIDFALAMNRRCQRLRLAAKQSER